MGNENHPKRVEPLAPAEMNREQAQFLAPFTDSQGRLPNVFATLVRHLPLLEAWRPFGLYTMRGSTVDPVLREIAILRAAHNSDSTYEWHHHCVIGRALGMDDVLFEAIRNRQPLEHTDQRLMVACADELHASTRLGDDTWSAMQNRFGLETTLDLIFTIGAYTTLAMALNSCGVRLEEDY